MPMEINQSIPDIGPRSSALLIMGILYERPIKIALVQVSFVAKWLRISTYGMLLW